MKLVTNVPSRFDCNDRADPVVRTRDERIRSGELHAGGQEYCPGSRRLGGWIVLVQSDCAPRRRRVFMWSLCRIL